MGTKVSFQLNRSYLYKVIWSISRDMPHDCLKIILVLILNLQKFQQLIQIFSTSKPLMNLRIRFGKNTENAFQLWFAIIIPSNDILQLFYCRYHLFFKNHVKLFIFPRTRSFCKFVTQLIGTGMNVSTQNHSH